MFPGQGGPNRPPWQQGFNNGPRRNGPPPAKRAKSGPGPIITRYPPPPGYTGPTRPPGSFQQPGWQQPQAQYGYGQPAAAYPGYPQQGYGPTPPYQQPSYGGPYAGAGQTNPAVNYYNQHNSCPTPTPRYHPAHPGYPQVQYNGGPNQLFSAYQPPVPPLQQGSSPPLHQHSFYNQQPRHNSAPSLSTHADTAPDLGGDDKSMPSELTQVSQAADDLETPYYGGECYYATHPNEIDPNLSLGEIVYHPALPTLRPLPATFDQAELEALAPRIPQPSDYESISEYFINSLREESLLDVRQTDRWQRWQNDHVFRTFPRVAQEHLSQSEMVAGWRGRPDPTWTERSPTPEPRLESNSRANGNEEQDVLGGLENALQQSSSAEQSSYSQPSNSSQIDRPRPMGVIRDQAQEDILSKLGVTGSPKMAYQTPGPARSGSISSDRGGFQQQSRRPPPPTPPAMSPPHQRTPSNDIWDNNPRTNGHTRGRRESNSSQHTAPGSDFHSDGEATPRPPLRADNRKRGHDDDGYSDAQGLEGPENDTPRPSHKQARHE